MWVDRIHRDDKTDLSRNQKCGNHHFEYDGWEQKSILQRWDATNFQRCLYIFFFFKSLRAKFILILRKRPSQNKYIQSWFYWVSIPYFPFCGKNSQLTPYPTSLFNYSAIVEIEMRAGSVLEVTVVGGGVLHVQSAATSYMDGIFEGRKATVITRTITELLRSFLSYIDGMHVHICIFDARICVVCVWSQGCSFSWFFLFFFKVVNFVVNNSSFRIDGNIIDRTI